MVGKSTNPTRASIGSTLTSAMIEKTMSTTRPVEKGSGLTTSVAASTSESAWASSSPVEVVRWNSSGTARK